MQLRARWFTPVRVALAVLLLITVVLLLLPFAVQIKWVGHHEVKLSFLLLDAATEQPIPNATIAFFEWRSNEGFEKITTDQKGSAVLTMSRLAAGGSGPFAGPGTVSMPDWYFEVRAPGYESRPRESLGVLIGTSRSLEDPHPPCIVIRLTRASSGTSPS